MTHNFSTAGHVRSHDCAPTCSCFNQHLWKTLLIRWQADQVSSGKNRHHVILMSPIFHQAGSPPAVELLVRDRTRIFGIGLANKNKARQKTIITQLCGGGDALQHAFLPKHSRGKHDDGYAGWFSLWCEPFDIQTRSTDDYRLVTGNGARLNKQVAIIFILENRLGILPKRNTK